MIDLLKSTLDRNREAYLRPLMDLIACDTHCLGHGVEGGLEAAGQAYMADLLRSMGAEVTESPMRERYIAEAIEAHQEGNPGHRYEGRANVYGRFPGKGGRSLMFNGHMDTMPAEEVPLWRFDPWTPTLDQGKLYGLGVCDMKGGLMAAVQAVRLLQDCGFALPGDVLICSVADEEGGGNGSIQAAMEGQKADGVVVCECSGHELITAHMGFVFFRVAVAGLACHSGKKTNGVSAIEKAVMLMAALDRLEHRWLLEYKHPLLPPPSLNVGVIRGGSAGSTVAADCVFEVCIHYLPGCMSREQVEREFEEAVGWACKGDPWLSNHPPTLTLYQAGGGFEMELEHPFTRAFEQAFAMAHGRPVPLAANAAGCDSRIWKNIAGCPTLQYGPGELAQCHARDEHITLASYYDAILTYAMLILSWCGNTQNTYT